jgi:AAT family amino acid transporter/D-serine/D-alanine/glycine transporter
MSQAPSAGLARGLQDRHVQFIAIGGAIGAGLFLGAGQAIHTAGPALLLDYAISGGVVFLIARALGELAVYRPVSGSFASYADEFIGPWAGFVTGWTYWLNWELVGIAEITAIGIYFHFWFPQLPQWIPALCAVVVLYGANLIAVRVYGEIEFILSMVKVITILAVIVVGLGVILIGSAGAHGVAGFSNLWIHGGFFPNGMSGLLLALPIAVFSFGGMEILGLTAGEAKDPGKSLPKAFNSIVYRILIFYIGSLTVIMTLYPWNLLDPKASPFVLLLARFGLTAAAGVINFVVITASASSCDSGLFGTSRMLYSMAIAKQAPHYLRHLSKRKVPTHCLGISAAMMLVGVLMNFLMPGKAFNYAISAVLSFLLWTWGVIMVSHMQYHRAVREGRKPAVSFRLPGAPASDWIVLIFLGFIAVLMATHVEMRTALYVATVWLVLLLLIFFGVVNHRPLPSTQR